MTLQGSCIPASRRFESSSNCVAQCILYLIGVGGLGYEKERACSPQMSVMRARNVRGRGGSDYSDADRNNRSGGERFEEEGASGKTVAIAGLLFSLLAMAVVGSVFAILWYNARCVGDACNAPKVFDDYFLVRPELTQYNNGWNDDDGDENHLELARTLTTKEITLPDPRVICVDGDADVRPGTTGSGKCWTDPFRDLQEALDYTIAHPEKCIIFVADGWYYPSKTLAPRNHQGRAITGGLFASQPGVDSDDNDVDYADDPEGFDELLRTFHVPNHVSIFGHFAGQDGPGGGETSTLQRDLDDNWTYLSGDLDAFQVWHVVTLGNEITGRGYHGTLDGLVVEDSDCTDAPMWSLDFPFADDVTPGYMHNHGGGIYMPVRGNLTMNNMELWGNGAFRGAGLFAWDGSTVRWTVGWCGVNFAEMGGCMAAWGGGPHSLAHYDASKHNYVEIVAVHFVANFAFTGSDVSTDNFYDDPTGGTILHLASNWHFEHGCECPNGASIDLYYGTLYALDMLCIANIAEISAAACLVTTFARVNISSSAMVDELCADEFCAAHASFYGSNVQIRNTMFTDGAGDTGAVLCEADNTFEEELGFSSTLDLYYDTFEGNTGDDFAGAVWSNCPTRMFIDIFVFNDANDWDPVVIDDANDGVLLLDYSNVFCSNEFDGDVDYTD